MTPEVSVVVAARSGPEALRRLEAALHDELSAGRAELVVAAESGAAPPPGRSVVPVTCAPGSGLAVLRAAGLLAARGDVIAMTRDVCVPEPGWLDRLRSTLARERAAAAGGVVALRENAPWADRVSHRLEYAGFRTGVGAVTAVTSLAATNVAYARTALFRHRALFETGYREDVLHAALVAAGERLVLDPGARVRLESAFPFRVHAEQRFHAGRIHAAARRARGGSVAGLVHALLTPALPPLLLARLWRQLVAEGEARAGAAWHATEAAPLVVCGVLGEIAGALAGPGSSEGRLA